MDELQETADVATVVDETDQRRAKLDYWRSHGVDPFGSRFVRTHSSRQIIDGFAELEGKHVSIAGRVMAVRSHGKASFFDLADLAGRIQVYAKHDTLGDEHYGLLQQVDIGDIMGVAGEVFRTRRGEISVALSSFTMLSKSLRPLPEKFHGLKDTDTRYRQRYLDLIVNPEVKKTFMLRSKLSLIHI